MAEKIHNVATNIISGFLGVGKTTAVLNLFENKPADEKWAVLVNEYGKIGIDGHLYQSRGIEVREISGGCICCAQGVALQVAINRMLHDTRPDRLIIESSGIGHPGGVLKTLAGEGFKEVLALKAGICLIDPENLLNPAYRDNELFQEQIQYADVLVANKTDLASAEALAAFEQLEQTLEKEKQLITTTTRARLKPQWLDYAHTPHTHRFSFKKLPLNQEKSWQTQSYQFDRDKVFNLEALTNYLQQLAVIRLKGLVKTDSGFYLLNLATASLDIEKLPKPGSEKWNYIEVINDELDINTIEQKLSACIV